MRLHDRRDLDRRIEPGKCGNIPIQFNSSSYGGQILKTVIVCDDPVLTNVTLQIKGTIWRSIEVTPTIAMFAGRSDNATNDVKIVHIVSHLDEPLTVSEPECTNHAFRSTLHTVAN